MDKLLLAALLCAVAGVASSSAPTVTLRNGVKLPLIAAGVYQYNESTAEASVGAALKVGFRLLDNALDYHNQYGVGRAIAASGVPRDQIFVETKVRKPLASSQ